MAGGDNISWVKLIVGNALTSLRGMDGESVNLIKTSPLYSPGGAWELRDYGVEGKVGLSKPTKNMSTTFLPCFKCYSCAGIKSMEYFSVWGCLSSGL